MQANSSLRKRLGALDRPALLKALTELRSSDPEIIRLFGHLPKSEIQKQFTGLSAEQTFQQAFSFLDVCQSAAAACTVKFGGDTQRVLDFGCGWGRITQLLSLHFEPANILGGDVMDAALNHCRESGVNATFHKLHFWPPSPIQDESIDFIFAYSVFSHLSEDNSDAWVREFARILKPGGMAFLTTRHRDFFTYIASLRDAKADIPNFARGAMAAFKDHNEALRKYDAGEFCFDPMGSGGPGLTAVYGEAAIPQTYAQTRWKQYFREVHYFNPVPSGLLDQATIAVLK